MNKRLAHSILFFGDLLSFGALWVYYLEFQRIMMEIANQADMIRFSNRLGFFIFGLLLPPLHCLSIVDRFWPDFHKKYDRLVNRTVMVALIILFAGGFFGSSWIQSKVENAGYLYCRQASGISTLAKSLVFTKNKGICEEMVTERLKRRR